MKRIEEVIRNNWEPQFKPIDECNFQKLAKAIRRHYLELLPKETFCVLPHTSAVNNMKHAESIGRNQAIQEMRERIEKC